MSAAGVTSAERVARALLYEGYVLYPYRPSAVKNRQRFNFGVVYPEGYSQAHGGTEPCEMRTECLVAGDEDSRVEGSVRFLHLFERSSERPGAPAWHEAIERVVDMPGVTIGALLESRVEVPIAFPAASEPGPQLALDARIELEAERGTDGVFRVRVTISNRTPFLSSPESRDEALLGSLVSAHTILRLTGGEFISLTDPPEPLKGLAATCRNVGTWPVLAGENGARDTLLSSPIIVNDFPDIAPESPGDFFDGTEMDEMLSLRILTLTDEEKLEARASDSRVRELLDRIESLGEDQLLQMHGVVRRIRALEDAG